MKAVICCTYQKSIHQSCVTISMQKQWRQAPESQCPNSRPVPNSQILCCKCRKMDSDSTTTEQPAESATQQRIWNAQPWDAEREKQLKHRNLSCSCCKLPATVTLPNSDLLHPIHQQAKKSVIKSVTVQSLPNFTCSECNRVIKKSSPRATCTTCGSRFMG